MSHDPKNEKKEEPEEAMYAVDTVPPPAGETDAYSAATRVGQMPPEVLEAMRGAGIDLDRKLSGSGIPAAPKPPRPSGVGVAPSEPAARTSAPPPKTALAQDATSDAEPAVAAPSDVAQQAKEELEDSAIEKVVRPPHARTPPPTPISTTAAAKRVSAPSALEPTASAAEIPPAPMPSALEPVGPALDPAALDENIRPVSRRIPREAWLVIGLVVASVLLAIVLNGR